jgi:single-strand DNA-binding protein
LSQITIVGNLTADPELRYTASGKAVASFTVVESSRVKDGDGWKDGPATFWRCSLWDSAAENLTESLTKGGAGDSVRRSPPTLLGDIWG